MSFAPWRVITGRIEMIAVVCLSTCGKSKWDVNLEKGTGAPDRCTHRCPDAPPTFFLCFHPDLIDYILSYTQCALAASLAIVHRHWFISPYTCFAQRVCLWIRFLFFANLTIAPEKKKILGNCYFAGWPFAMNPMIRSTSECKDWVPVHKYVRWESCTGSKRKRNVDK